MISKFLTYIKEQLENDDEWIECPSDYIFEKGERVKIKPESRYIKQVSGNGTGTIYDTGTFCYVSNAGIDESDPVWYVRWDDGTEGCFYWRVDLLINKEKNKERKRKIEILRDKMKDVDPYGEEDWLDESNKYNFKLGDKVEYIGKEILNRFKKNKCGTIIKINYNNSYGVEFDEHMEGHDCKGMPGRRDGVGKYGHCWNVISSDIRHVDPEKEKFIIKRREELKNRMKDVDPYGEEDWENESNTFNELDPYGEEIWEDETLQIDTLIRRIKTGELIIILLTNNRGFNIMNTDENIPIEAYSVIRDVNGQWYIIGINNNNENISDEDYEKLKELSYPIVQESDHYDIDPYDPSSG